MKTAPLPALKISTPLHFRVMLRAVDPRRLVTGQLLEETKMAVR